MIDVKQLIAGLSDARLLASADAYFSGLGVDSEQCFKPFSNIGDAPHLTRSLGLLLEAAELFKGADVLDFGCATGWLTMGMADMGCTATGIDIAPAALRLAGKLQANRSTKPPGSARFVLYEGNRLDFADHCFDRIVCFDAFHHVKNQQATLAEFARVLRPGGRIAMLEPGPNHSKTPQSQMEMTRYTVIENDICMRSIATMAGQCGLLRPQMLVQLAAPERLDVEDFLKWSASPLQGAKMALGMVNRLQSQMTNTQCFYISKTGSAHGDSRHASALQLRLRLVSSVLVQQEEGGEQLVEIVIEAVNLGLAAWLAQTGRAGEVRLGCQKLDAQGVVTEPDFRRYALATEAVLPGQSALVTALVPLPKNGEGYRFDLVAEQICWFSEVNGNAPLVWHPDASG